MLHETPLVNTHHKRVSLAGEDLDLIYDQWLSVGPLHFDYCHCVAVDGKYPIWIAGNGNKAEAVPVVCVINLQNCWQRAWSSPLPFFDIYDSKRRSRSTRIAPRAVNERTVEYRDNGCLVGDIVVPGCDVSLTCWVV